MRAMELPEQVVHGLAPHPQDPGDRGDVVVRMVVQHHHHFELREGDPMVAQGSFQGSFEGVLHEPELPDDIPAGGIGLSRVFFLAHVAHGEVP